MRAVILVNEVILEVNGVGDILKIESRGQRLINVSRIVDIKSLSKNITKEILDFNITKQFITTSKLHDVLGGSEIVYMDGYGNLRYVTALETPHAIYEQLCHE